MNPVLSHIPNQTQPKPHHTTPHHTFPLDHQTTNTNPHDPHIAHPLDPLSIWAITMRFDTARHGGSTKSVASPATPELMSLDRHVEFSLLSHPTSSIRQWLQIPEHTKYQPKDLLH
ncbi:hypothetical protein ACMFMG_011866 [Clarireedia jacksonii]